MKKSNKTVYLRCNGPAIEPSAEKCIESLKPTATGWLKIGHHEISNEGDGASYNGIRNWRCSVCFTEHRKRIREQNT